MSKGNLVALATCSVALALTTVACGDDDSSKKSASGDRGPIHVAVITDKTGAYAAASAYQGIEAYFKRINRDGGVGGSRVEVSFYDAGSDPAKALQATQKAIASKPAAVISASSSMYTALPTLAKSGIPGIGEGYAPQWNGNPTLFSPYGDLTGHLSDVWLKVLKQRGVRKVGLATAPIQKNAIEVLDQAAGKLDMDVVYKDTSLPTVLQSADSLRVAQQIDKSGAEGVVFFGSIAGPEVVANLTQLGSRTKVIETSKFGEDLLKEFGSRVDGMIFGSTSATIYTRGNPGIERYKADMKAAGFEKVMNNNAYGPVRWSQARFLVERGLKPAGPPYSPSAIIKSLSRTKGYTAGGVIPGASFPELQQAGTRCLNTVEVKKGKWVSSQNGKFPFVCGGPSKALGR